MRAVSPTIRTTPSIACAARGRPGASADRPRGRVPALVLVAILGGVACCLLYRLGAWPLIEPDEGRNAEVAREMLASGRWAVPQFDGMPYLDKPVLLFWLVAGAFRLLGVSETAARLPSALAGLATVALTFDLGRMLLGRRRGLVAAVVVATTPMIMAYARIVIFDLPLTALVTAALCCLVHARLGGDDRVWLPLAGVAMGLAVLAKGPVGVAVPAIVWGAGAGALPDRRRRTRGTGLAAVAAGALVVVPWLAVVERQQPGFLRYALVDETLLRLTSPERFHRAGPVYFYAATLAWALGIWGVVLAALSPALIGPRRLRGRGGAVAAFALRAVAALIVFFTLSASKRPHYIMPALVPLGLLAAVTIDAQRGRAAAVVRGVAFMLLAGGVGVVAAVVVRPGNAGALAVPGAQVMAVGLALVAWGVATIACARAPWGAFACAALLTPLLGVVLVPPLTSYADGRSSRALARYVGERRLLAYETFRTSLPFYLGRPVPLVGRTAGALTGNYLLTRPVQTLDNLLAPGDLGTLETEPDPPLVLVRRWDVRAVRRLVAGRLRVVYSDRHGVLLAPDT